VHCLYTSLRYTSLKKTKYVYNQILFIISLFLIFIFYLYLNHLLEILMQFPILFGIRFSRWMPRKTTLTYEQSGRGCFGGCVEQRLFPLFHGFSFFPKLCACVCLCVCDNGKAEGNSVRRKSGSGENAGLAGFLAPPRQN